jgi:hypothetical protein
MSGMLTSLLVFESVLTMAAVIMLIYRGMLDMKEEDHLILDEAESHFAREQVHIRKRVVSLSLYLKMVSIAWGILLVVIFGVWIAKSLNLV